MKTRVTEIHRIDADRPDELLLEAAAEVLRNGGLVAFPTETVYGLGANALDPAAVARIFEAKGRPSNNPVIVHGPDAEALRALVTIWPVAAARLAERFWPGPLTLVLPRNRSIPDIVTAGGPTVAIRAPAHPVALALLRKAGIPIAAPSANRSMRLSPTRAEHVARSLSGRIDMILDGGPTAGGLESTVLDLTVTPPRLLRPGLIAPAEIEAVVGPITRPADLPQTDVILPSPGMLGRHYAPRAPLELAEDDGANRVHTLLSQGLNVGWIAYGQPIAAVCASGLEVVVLPAEPAAYAARLYAALHDLDEQGVDRIVVAQPPAGEEWLAIRDRLRRAAQT